MAAPSPVEPPVSYEARYGADVRRLVWNPLREQLRAVTGLSGALSWIPAPVDDVARTLATRFVAGINRYHLRRLVLSLRAATGLDVRKYLDVPRMQLRTDALYPTQDRVWLENMIAENVALIRTIPTRFQSALRKRLLELSETVPLDQSELQRVIHGVFRKHGYVLRRIVRDQTNKTIGKMTQYRHQKLGITSYTWRSAGDQRVRPEHRANNGHVFRWDQPPSTGHPGHAIQCRCVAIPKIDTSPLLQPVFRVREVRTRPVRLRLRLLQGLLARPSEVLEEE